MGRDRQTGLHQRQMTAEGIQKTLDEWTEGGGGGDMQRHISNVTRSPLNTYMYFSSNTYMRKGRMPQKKNVYTHFTFRIVHNDRCDKNNWLSATFFFNS